MEFEPQDRRQKLAAGVKQLPFERSGEQSVGSVAVSPPLLPPAPPPPIRLTLIFMRRLVGPDLEEKCNQITAAAPSPASSATSRAANVLTR